MEKGAESMNPPLETLVEPMVKEDAATDGDAKEVVATQIEEATVAAEVAKIEVPEAEVPEAEVPKPEKSPGQDGEDARAERPGTSQLVAAGGDVLAEQSDEVSEDDLQVQCKKCGRLVHVTESLHRTERTRWCLSCNALVTLMRRHMSWPPDEFAKLSEESQKTFFLKAVEEKAGTSAFRYDRVRDLLVKTMVKMHISESSTETGGTYKPLSVFAKDGYILPPEFEDEAPKLWSTALRCWTYLLPELTVKETEINRSMEEAVVKAEKAIKKRKQLPDGAGSSKEPKDKTEALEDLVVDLLSDEEDAEQVPGRFFF